jgi:hypothetical protein
MGLFTICTWFRMFTIVAYGLYDSSMVISVTRKGLCRALELRNG